ncbi:MAG: HAMP domain-containing histidine kinase [Oscillospiraceae bacterium]|jgi:hypothetical protein|nr:HAMP domain-containing histidine kinase [Oscillospiraceae bacterium]
MQLSSLFEVLSEPVVAARGGEIIYRNAAARQTPVLARRGLADLIPEYAASDPPEAFLTEMSVDGERYMVSCAPLDEMTVCTFTPERPANPADASDIVASAAAALRGPLALLKLASDRMLEQDGLCGVKDSSEYASAMRRGIFGMARALNHLDAFVFLAESGSALPERAYFDIVRVCRDLTRDVALALDLSDGRLTFSSAAGASAFYGDKRLIERMLLCLIGNAFAFTPEGTSVHLSVGKAGGRTLISVTDDGGGFPEGVGYDVWARYRARDSFRSVGRGAGMGLSVVQSIARMHGGGAVLESRAGVGASVLVSLPSPGPGLKYRAAGGRKPEYSPADGMDEILTELAELVPPEKFSAKYSD